MKRTWPTSSYCTCTVSHNHLPSGEDAETPNREIFVPFVICADFLCDGYFYLFVFRYVPKSGPAKIMYRTAFWFMAIFENPRDVIHTSLIFFSPCWGSGMSIPDPNFFPSRIRIKEFKFFSPKNSFYALGNMIRVVHPGSQIRILIFLPPGSATLCFLC